ncbi:hypothetical protein [Actinacidiphila acididurans]|uniref:Uncharacterized protein n=1 Tax=Actinacidiphila acididurans TaxID=2784346 RepID=A0ABS2TMK0_9ACTN|nr:hypothetical protein [Actinacidiphila acididurans]MBM9504553.1 hypothetical protein [Actinacidiphila acididurans]
MAMHLFIGWGYLGDSGGSPYVSQERPPAAHVAGGTAHGTTCTDEEHL